MKPHSEQQSDASVFLRARFAGGRFDSHTMPLEVLPDLASYRRLVVEVAKYLFKSTHGSRVRVPKGFEESFQLSVSSIKGGNSSVADLVINQKQSPYEQVHLFAPYPEFEQARDLIARVIGSVSKGEKLPEIFPQNLVGFFNPFGNNLLPDEFLELGVPGLESVRYTDGIRRAIVLSAEQLIEGMIDAEFTLNGGIVHTETIHMLDDSGRNLDFQPTSQFEFSAAYEKAGSRVRIIGNGLFDQTGTLRRILSGNIIDFDRTTFHRELKSAFGEITDSVDPENTHKSNIIAKLTKLRSIIEDSTSEDLDLGRPFIYTLEEGDISIEWTRGTLEANIYVYSSGPSYVFHALDSDTSKDYWEKISEKNSENLRAAIEGFFKAIIGADRD